ncbi:hypothetical protein Tco_0860811 [Tanacetum coccineum]|uniref:Secreted protein n=1 Tax=Tanacetum coccineum TaxID=301880 RepID=A0ABQ5BK23_9ASTR
MMLVVVAWEWWCGCGDVAAVGWRVEESGSEDRIDRVTRNVFGFGRKSPPENFSAGGGGGGQRLLAGGAGWPE